MIDDELRRAEAWDQSKVQRQADQRLNGGMGEAGPRCASGCGTVVAVPGRGPAFAGDLLESGARHMIQRHAGRLAADRIDDPLAVHVIGAGREAIERAREALGTSLKIVSTARER